MLRAPQLLLVDDDDTIRFVVGAYLMEKGYEVVSVDSCAAAEDAFRLSRPDVALVDYLLPDGDALGLLCRLRDLDDTVPIVVLTGYSSIDLAVRAMKEGAEHFLTKPVELPALEVVLGRCLENQRARRGQLAGRAVAGRNGTFPFLGGSVAIRRLDERARKLVDTDATILIQGETGTGKGVLARWLHSHGPRAPEAFVDLNCAGLSREFLETELFGHEKGAFTGAAGAKPGLLEVAHRGTVFLDEIGDVDREVQPKLLKVLEEKRYRRLGDVRDRSMDIRLIAATHQDLPTLVAGGRFRSDLYYRISTLLLTIPPLRERTEDVVPLAMAILGQLPRGGSFTLSSGAARALAEYSWPGNIRELRNVLERAVLLAEHTVLAADDLSLGSTQAASLPAPESWADLSLEEVQRLHIRAALEREDGNVDRAAVRLGVPRSTLYQRIKKLGLRDASAESQGT